MAKKTKNEINNKFALVSDYRHPDAKRKNIPPAKIAAEGVVPTVPKIQYTYSPRRSPELRFDPSAAPDKLPKLLEEANTRRLTATEVKTLADALRTQEPWLEWAGKLEQNRRGLQVDPVALHIHERVSAQAILKIASRQDVQRDMFADPQQTYAQAVQFYKHEIGWTNRMILGDSLQVMTSLAQREDLSGKVQMIYVDPPYGIKFASNFQPEIGKRDVSDKQNDLTREPEMVKAYRDTWTLGVHSYLAYLRDRLVLCREMLADSGSIFVQISDENLHLVRTVMDEVFGQENFLVTLVVKTKGSQKGGKLDPINMYLLWYGRNHDQMKVNKLSVPRGFDEDGLSGFNLIQRTSGEVGTLRFSEDGKPILNNDEVPVTLGDMTNGGYRRTTSVPFTFCGKEFKPGPDRCWSVSTDNLQRVVHAERVHATENQIRFKKHFYDFPNIPLTNLWTDTGGAADKIYVVQTASKVIERCMLLTTKPGDLVFDPTCGSGTTAYVAELWGRRWIMTDTSRVALSLARQRLLTSKFDYFELNEEAKGIAGGFRYKTVPHITLKSIAQNTNLDPIFANHEPLLDQALAACNSALAKVTEQQRAKLLTKTAAKQREEGKKAVTDADLRRWQLPKKGEQWQHWQVPFDTDPDWPKELQQAVTNYRTAWRAKMDEVNACISANAEQEELVDKPQVKRAVVRVSGPFTVEAMQPPEISLTEQPVVGGAPESLPDAFDLAGGDATTSRQNIEAYLDQMTKLLRVDGVRFPDNKQMKFSRLERIAGTDGGIHAEGRWVPQDEQDSDADGKATVAVAFGPQYGPVTAKQVEELIRATNRRGYDNLVIAGFSFDGPAQATVTEASHPKLRVDIAHIRPDVNPGMAGLLKETPNSQLFSVFGQPRTSVTGPDKEKNYVVKMEGVDIYDPVTNTIQGTGDQKVAAWFLDGDYDGRTFCITQAFFPDKSTWEKLGKALSGVINTEIFDALSGTTSLPFPAGQNSCAAVKVIDPRGNEVMSVHKLA